MATGLPSFDAFSWASLLAGWPVLVIDADASRGRGTAAALEEAGAVATLAPGLALGLRRLDDRAFRIVVLGLAGDETVGEAAASRLAGLGTRLLILADPARRAVLRQLFPDARLVGHGTSDRDLVLFVTGSADA